MPGETTTTMVYIQGKTILDFWGAIRGNNSEATSSTTSEDPHASPFLQLEATMVLNLVALAFGCPLLASRDAHFFEIFVAGHIHGVSRKDDGKPWTNLRSVVSPISGTTSRPTSLHWRKQGVRETYAVRYYRTYWNEWMSCYWCFRSPWANVFSITRLNKLQKERRKASHALNPGSLISALIFRRISLQSSLRGQRN